MSGSVAVAGGGIIGLSIAWRLAQAGWRVEIFDQSQMGQEASWAGAGMLAPGGEVETEGPLALLAVESRARYREFVSELEGESGLSIDMQEAGALELAYSPAELAALNAKAPEQQRLGIASRPVSLEQVRSFWPRVRRDGLAGARFYPGDAIVNPREVVAALQVALRARGAELHERSPVATATVDQSGVELDVAAGSMRRFDAAVIAMGAWSSVLTVGGVPALPEAFPVKGHLIGYQQPDQTCSTILRHGHTYLLQRANGLLIVGASVEHAGFDRTLQAETTEMLAREAASVLPHLGETTPTEVWAGFRPGGEALHIGAWHSPRLYLAYGHYRNGILLAPVTADRIARELTANLRMP